MSNYKLSSIYILRMTSTNFNIFGVPTAHYVVFPSWNVTFSSGNSLSRVRVRIRAVSHYRKTILVIWYFKLYGRGRCASDKENQSLERVSLPVCRKNMRNRAESLPMESVWNETFCGHVCFCSGYTTSSRHLLAQVGEVIITMRRIAQCNKATL